VLVPSSKGLQALKLCCNIVFQFVPQWFHLTEIDVYNGGKTVVVVVVVVIAYVIVTDFCCLFATEIPVLYYYYC